ncbi:putative nuclease PA3 [Microdochium trichocladiopsis]|uniref:Nuclease PA3 n=1 Tax=Microdochium trichocladiopsis TaxID=1682393 RepID=A0A9P8Y4Z1_9PEZI|nr:putative nuclease PA3 [Microdochium trichocladiopsis]KAH7029776.1 putative nuclease PA3 [Microdochium trichocladiopsis]
MTLIKTLVLGLACANTASAWGVLGHATVAYVAQNYVDSATATWAQGLLGDTSDSFLAKIASWADTYRTTTAGKWSAPLHFIDAEDSPPTSCNIDYDRDCGSTGCSISAVANYTSRIKNSKLSKTDRAEALKFLTHFIGDITQPLHDEALERGGNDITVTFDGYSTDNLHAIWDTYIPQKDVGGSALTDAQTWSRELISAIDSGTYASTKKSWISGDDIADPVTTATRWAADANALVCSVVMPKGVGALQKGDLYPDYYNSVLPTIEMQIAKAGYRLANWLNKLHAASVSKSKRTERDEVEERVALELDGREFLPAPRPLSHAKKIRELHGYDCGHDHH